MVWFIHTKALNVLHCKEKMIRLLFISLMISTAVIADMENYLTCVKNCDWTSHIHEIKGCVLTCQIIHKTTGAAFQQVGDQIQRRYDEMVRDDKIKKHLI